MTNFVVNFDKVLMKKFMFSPSPIEMASFCGGVHHKKYNVERDKTFLKTKNVLLLKNIKSENLNKLRAS